MFTLPKLSYSYDALEPYIDARTMEIHHTKHHQTYVDKLNMALADHPEWLVKPIEQVMREIDRVPENVRQAVRNHGGGHANHSFFWQLLSAQPESQPSGALSEAIKKSYGGLSQFQEKFTATALNHFGSGWAWLVRKKDGSLDVFSTSNQDSPLFHGDEPILGLDVWEHAYYLKYQNRRPDYVQAFWQVLNWDQAEKNFLE